jgi:hypothetical protein
VNAPDTYGAHLRGRCGCRSTVEGNRLVRACKVPGTPEAGRVNMLKHFPKPRMLRHDSKRRASLMRFESCDVFACRVCGRDTSYRYGWVPDGDRPFEIVEACDVVCFTESE